MDLSGIFRIDTKMQLLLFAFQTKSIKQLLVRYMHSGTLVESGLCKELKDFLEQSSKSESLKHLNIGDPVCMEALTNFAVNTICKKDGIFYLLAHTIPLVNRLKFLQKKITKGNTEKYIENMKCAGNEIDITLTYSAITTCLKLSSSERVLLKFTFDSNSINVSEMIEPDMNFASIFLIAVICGSLSILDTLWDHEANTEQTKLFLTNLNNELTALHLAILTGNMRVVSWLLQKDFLMEAVNENGDTGLHLAASAGHKDIAESLIRCGNCCDARNANKQTPLHKAAGGGRGEIVDILVKNNATVEAQNASGNTPLIAAAENGHLHIVEQLLNYGAVIYATNFKKNSCLHRAAFHGHSEIVDLILSKGADIVDVQSDIGKTALHIASERGHLQVVKLLLGNNASINSRNNFGQTPLHEAARNGHTDVSEFLLKCGASGEIVDLKNRTALHEAAWNGHMPIVSLLLPCSDVNALDKNNNTALRLAEKFEKFDVVELLKKVGGK